jgi:hypothetical protein
MIYLAIDDKTKESKAMLEFLALQKYTHIYKEPNTVTKKAIAEARAGKANKVDSLKNLFKELHD